MTSPLLALSADDLRTLAAALESGKLGVACSAFALRRFVSPTQAEAIAAELRGLADSPQQLARVITLLGSARTDSRPAVDLVWTGPEGPGTASRDTAIVVRELFSSADESVLVAGYAIYQGRTVFQALAARMEELPGLKVTMFLDIQRRHGDTTRASDLVREFASRFATREWPGARFPDVYYDPRSLEADVAKRSSLHAKCVVVDRRRALVSSANFTEAAQVRNIEVGALIADPAFAAALAQHFESLVGSKLLIPVPLGRSP